MTSPRVSVCTSVLNQSDYLRRMIASVQAQTMTDWELVLVDDGSTEDIKGLVEGLADPRIKLHVFPENKGIPHGLNHALANARGDYVQPLSADEWIEPGKFAVQVEYLDKYDGIGCVWGLPGTTANGMGERPTWEQYAWKAHNRSREAWIRTLLRLEHIPIGGASMLMRRTCYEAIGGFDPQFFHCSDLEWFIRFFQKFDGRVLPYRWADADQPADRLTATKDGSVERFQADWAKVKAKHKLVLPPTSGHVTVGIPCYNMAHFIGKTLDSLRAQTFKDFDILILDDASTDDLAQALAPYTDMGITLLKFTKNMGVRRAVNALIASAEGDFFVTVAADDWVEPTFLAKCLAEFKADPYLEFVASQTDFYDKDAKPLAQGTHPVQGIPKATNLPREQWLANLWYGNRYFGVGMYRTYALREIGGFDTEAGCLTDYDVYLKLLQRENIKILEEPLTHTRLHDGNISMNVEGQPPKFTQQWLRAKYTEIKKRYYPPRMKVIIATPFYEMRGFSPYISSMAYTIRLLTMLGVEHEFWELSGDSYVDRAKNTIMNKFLEDTDATHLFMIDSDMQWNPDAVVQMLHLPEEIVVGSYPQKNAWGKWTSLPEVQTNAENPSVAHPIGRMLPNGTALLKSQFLAGGFMKISRSALEKFRDKHTQYRYRDSSADPSCPEREYVEFSTCEVKDGMRWGEDRVFGKRLQECGVEAWIYPNIQFGHYGIKGWTGNFDTFLRGQVKPDAVAEANTQVMN